MTTIVWNRRVLVGDTYGSLEDGALGMFGIPVGDNLETKIFTPSSSVHFEKSPLIAVGGAGELGIILALKAYLFSHDTSRSQFCKDSSNMAAKTGRDCDLFILTVKHCWMVSVRSQQTLFKDVTNSLEAIGTGRNYAFMLMKKGGGAIASVLLASCNDGATNDKVTLVKWKEGCQFREATAFEHRLGWLQIKIFEKLRVFNTKKDKGEG